MRGGHVVVGMSGGVDSAVAAYLLKRDGYDVVGVFMKNWEEEGEDGVCTAAADYEDVKSVSGAIGIPYYTVNFAREYRERVFSYFLSEYRAGRTPNPDVLCNCEIKFRAFLDFAMATGASSLATGHYARITFENGQYQLRKALDETKDQSYVLYAMTQRELAHTLFPLGAMRKSETRAIAETQGFGNARKRDSQDICFAPDGDYAATIGRLTGEKSVPGAFVSTDGRVLGEHKGIIHYTVGQRCGLGISHGERLYVCRIDPERNEVVLGEEKDLYRSEAAVSDVNWISGETPREPARCAVKIRYRAREQAATVYPEENGRGRIVFDAPQRAVTPGQAAVFYDGDTVLGGGTIE